MGRLQVVQTKYFNRTKPDMETNEGTADEQERMTNVNTDQTDTPQPIYVCNMFIKKEEVDEENNTIEEENH